MVVAGPQRERRRERRVGLCAQCVVQRTGLAGAACPQHVLGELLPDGRELTLDNRVLSGRPSVRARGGAAYLLRHAHTSFTTIEKRYAFSSAATPTEGSYWWLPFAAP